MTADLDAYKHAIRTRGVSFEALYEFYGNDQNTAIRLLHIDCRFFFSLERDCKRERERQRDRDKDREREKERERERER